MPYLENDRVTVTDPASAYYGKFGTVIWYWSGLECPVVDVKLDNLFGEATFNETAIALGEHKMKPLTEYEYNLRVLGKIFYDTWQTKEEMIALWQSGSFGGSTLQELKSHLTITQPYWKLVRRIRTEIEDV